MTEHRIRWFARLDGEWIPRTRQMRGAWGWDVKCSCGWETRTGGATETSIRRDIWQHKFLAEMEAK